MSWKAYELTYRSLAPIHIGAGKLGMVQKTSHYLPGRTMWGAATARLAQAVLASSSRIDNIDSLYRTIGEEVAANLVLSCFFPTIQDSSGCRVYLPGQHETELHLIASTTSTAITAGSLTADAASLHETEYISSNRKTDGRPVNLIGYLFEKEGSSFSFAGGEIPLSNAWAELFVGGERKCGFGRLRLLEFKSIGDDEALWGNSLNLDLSGSLPHVRVAADTSAAGQIAVTGLIVDGLSGDPEPLVSRAWRSGGGRRRGSGQALSYIATCYPPGARFARAHLFEIQKYGIWQEVGRLTNEA